MGVLLTSLLESLKLLLLAHVSQALGCNRLEGNGFSFRDGFAWVVNVMGSILNQFQDTLLKLEWRINGGNQLWAKWGLFQTWLLVLKREFDC